MRIILLGAPGAGKGTQAEILSKRYNIPIIGTGNLIREEIKQGTDLGKQIKEFAQKGQLVPDEIVINMLKMRMAQPDASNGYILDGFPRNVTQAKALDTMGIQVDKVVDIYVPDAEITKRLTGRRVCGKCGSSYHIEFKKPKQQGVCDNDSEALLIRDDDKPEVVSDRLKVYHEETEPLIGYYDGLSKLKTVDGLGNVDDITHLIVTAMEA